MNLVESLRMEVNTCALAVARRPEWDDSLGLIGRKMAMAADRIVELEAALRAVFENREVWTSDEWDSMERKYCFAAETACDAECRCGHPKAAHVASTFTNCDHCSCIDYEPKIDCHAERYPTEKPPDA